MFNTLSIICFFTFLIHLTESVAYSMRLSGIRTRQIAIAMSFVSSTLLVSRLSNMFQAPLLGAMVDSTVLLGTTASLHQLEGSFRLVIFAAFLGSLVGAMMTPTAVELFQAAMRRFMQSGSLPRVALAAFRPRNTVRIIKAFKLPRLHSLKGIRLGTIPRTFLIVNVVVTAVYTIGVLCSLLAGAYLPEMRSTAIQLSGIVNGIATIFFTIIVDPSGARITDQVYHHQRPEADVRSVIFFLLIGRIFGTFILAQLIFLPFTYYIVWVTKLLSRLVVG